MAESGGRPPRSASGRAVVVLILGIASLVSCFPLPAVGAIALAPAARREIAASGGTIGGEPLIKVGVACGWASLALTVVILVVFVGFLALRH